MIVAGLPAFVKYDVDDNKVKAVEQLEESSRIIKPPNIEEYPYEPYEFANIKEVEKYVDRAKGETVDSLYLKVKSISQKYNDQDEHKIVLLAADSIWSYFQDKFSTTHYAAVIGDSGSGKNTYGDTFGAIGYRAINMTDPTAANIFRVLGTIEPGQCTIIADEAEKIDQSSEIMSTLKTGYHIKSKVPRVNMNNNKQEFFWTFCFKMMIAERSPDISKAKGVMDRTFKIKTYKGRPQSDIKEVLKPSGNPRLQSLLNELTDLRKLMLVYRLIHFKDAVVDIDIGLEGRNKELCKPLLQLFYNTNSQNEVKSSLQQFVDSKNQTKGHTIEAVLYPIVVNLISKIGNKVYASQLWYEITHNLDGKYDDRKPNEYHTVDYNILYRNTITNIICDKFGASREPKKDGTVH